MKGSFVSLLGIIGMVNFLGNENSSLFFVSLGIVFVGVAINIASNMHRA